MRFAIPIMVFGMMLGLFHFFTNIYFGNHNNLILLFFMYIGVYGFVFLFLGLIMDFNEKAVKE